MIEALKLELMGLPPDTALTEDQKWFGIEFNPKSLTMVSKLRLDNLEALIHKVVNNDIEGDLIETGVWRGGCSILISKVLTMLGSDKKVFAADSFKGLPPPNERYIHDDGDYHHKLDYLAVDLETVYDNFVRFECEPNYYFVEGWFKDTLHKLDNKFSLIRLDGDMYESTINALDALYPKLSIGGYCIIDDYRGVPNCPFAVNYYRDKFNITDKMIEIDNTAVYWQKTK